MSDNTPDEHFEPAVRDVLAVKNALLNRFALPLNIIDMVIDLAEYWPHTATIRTGGEIRAQPGQSRADPGIPGGSQIDENKFVLRSYPLGYVPLEDNPTTCSMTNNSSFPVIEPKPWDVPEESLRDITGEIAAQLTQNQTRGQFPCRKIVFVIKSHDQGWGGKSAQRGTYNGSFTWFEAGQERLVAFKDTPEAKLLPQEPGTAGNEKVIPDSGEAKAEPDSNPASPWPQFTLSAGGDIGKEGSKSNEGSTTYTLRTLSPPTLTKSQNPPPTLPVRELPFLPNATISAGPSTPTSNTFFSHTLLPPSTVLQKNKTATHQTQTHTITWRYDDAVHPDSAEARKLLKSGRGPASATGEYVRALRTGDLVTVWAKARFPGWVNSVFEVGVRVYWAV